MRRACGAANRCRRKKVRRCAGFGQQLLQFSAAMHVEHDVTTADQLTVHVELRIGRPVRKLLERVAQLGILENVHRVKSGARGTQRGDRLGGKSALREIRRAFHEQHRGLRRDMSLDPTENIICHVLSPLFERPDQRPLRLSAHGAPARDLIDGAQATGASIAGDQHTDFDAGRLRAFHGFGPRGAR